MSRLLLPLALALALVGCRSSGEVADAEPGFGHRTEEEGPRRTMLLAPPEAGEEFFTYPAVVTNVEVRTGPTLPDGRRPVELLLSGALPDACTYLHDLREARLGHLIDVTFEIRRPKGVVCAQVVRPFRFYYELDEPLALGPYTLRLNDAVHPFEVLPERPGRR